MAEAPLRALVPSGLERRLTRRGFLSAAAAGGAMAALAACAGPGALGKALNIYTWSDYDDPDVLRTFGDRDGVRITLDSYGSNPELIAKLAVAKGTTGYDICVPTHSAIQQMVKNDLLEVLDLDRIPNFANLDPSVIDTKWDPGNKHSICKDWGTTGFVYDTTKLTGKPRSWKDFWELVQGPASGSVSLLEDQAEIGMAFFFANGMNPNTERESDVSAYRKFALDDVAPHVQKFSSSISTQMANSEQALIHAWNGDARQGKLNSKDPDRYRFVYPTEGGNLWQDNWAIVKGSPNTASAYAFIDYVLRPAVSLKEIAYIGYNTGVKGIEQLATDIDLPELVFIDDQIMTKLVYSEQTTVDQQIVDIYNDLVAKAGA